MGKSKDLATGAAYQDQTESDTRYVNTAGDTMSGGLTVNGGNISLNASNEAAHRYLYLNAGDTNDGHILFQRGGSPKFQLSADTNGHLFTWNYAKNGTSFRINTDGSVIKPHQPHIFGTVGNTSGHSLGGAGTCNRMAVSTSGGGMTFSNSRITVPVAGVYFISWQTITSSQGSGRYDTNIRLNGSNISNGLNNASDASNDYRMRTHILARDLSANDYLQFYHNNPYADGASFNDWSIVSVFLLG